MTAIAQQIVTPVVCDPNSVAETFANGPINIHGMGSVVTLTFTSVRPKDLAALLKGATGEFSAVVVSRVTMPLEVAIELRNLLNRTFVDQPQMAMGSTLTQ
jgi:hypothetical protein